MYSAKPFLPPTNPWEQSVNGQIPSDVDFRIMLTFLEFYQTFVSFINYRLYTSINLVYPPKLDMEKDEAGAGLSAYLIQSALETQKSIETELPTKHNTLPVKDTTKQLETLPSKIASLIEETDLVNPSATPPPTAVDDEKLDTFTPVHPDGSTLVQPTQSAAETSNHLFRGLHVYLSRETPVDALTFLLLSFSVSSLSTDPTTGYAPYSETDARITHQICDRGKLPNTIVPGRKYVQPQWVVDSINRGTLLDEALYVPGTELPAHLSPFVEKTEGRYDPEAPVEVEESEEEEEEEVDEDMEHQRLLEAEVAGAVAAEKVGGKRKKRKAVDEDAEANEMAKLMMSNKNRRLLEAMEYGNRKRRDEKEKLQSRKKELVKEEQKRKKVKLG
jgi:pescadillo